MRFPVAALVLGMIFVAGCEEKPAYVPTEDEERLMKAYASLLVLHEQFDATTSPDSIQLYHQKLDSILHSHDLDRDEFQRQFQDLLDSPERFKPLLQEISAILQKGVDRR